MSCFLTPHILAPLARNPAATTRRPRVAILYKSLPQYRREFFDRLRIVLAARGIDLDLIYGQPGTADSTKRDCVDLPWATRIKNRIFKVGAREAYWQPCLAQTAYADLVIVEQANKLLINYVLLALRIFGRRRVAFWGHGRDFQAHGKFQIRERIKRYLARHVDWWFAYNDTSRAAVGDTGFPADRITNVQNAIDTRHLVQARAAVTPEQIAALRAQLRITGRNVCLYAGGMYADKRLDFLLAACDHLRAADDQFEMIFLGSGPQAPFIAEAARTRPWLHFVGPRFDADKVVYFAASKLLLMPGLVGLVVLDSFALQTPLVTTDLDYHSPEIEYLKHDENGCIAPATDDPAVYAAAVAALLSDDPRRQSLVEGCRAAAAQYTVEEMVRRFSDGVCAALCNEGSMS